MSKRRSPSKSALTVIVVGAILIIVAFASVYAPRTVFRREAGPIGAARDRQESPAGGEESATSTEGYPYIVINQSCGPYYGGECVNMRSGPGAEFPSQFKLRNGIVLKVATTTVNGKGETWYKIDPGRNIRHPDRIKGDWYVSAAFSELFYNKGEEELSDEASTTKRILVSVGKQRLYAFEGGTLFLENAISTGRDLSPTQRGVFYVYYKTPSRYMQGPIEGVTDDVYDLPGVPWNLYFTYDGAVVHGAYWHNNFGRQWSHGCVNLPPNVARKLYEWADIGTEIIITE